LSLFASLNIFRAHPLTPLSCFFYHLITGLTWVSQYMRTTSGM
jgi:hypothetical protein